MAILEELPSNTGDDMQPEDITTDTAPLPPRKVSVIDGMAVVQEMGKSPWFKTCAQWADHFTATLDSKYSDCDEVHLVYDRYDLPTSLKEATRERDARVASRLLLIMSRTTHQSVRCQHCNSCPVSQPKMN